MPERDDLLAQLRRIRRRRRSVAALRGGVLAGTGAALLLLVVVLIMHRTGAAVIGVRAASSALLIGVALGAVVRALRPISLGSCARAVDEALMARRRASASASPGAHARAGGTVATGAAAPNTTDENQVLAAAALAETNHVETRFVAVVMAEAAGLVKTVSSRDAVPITARHVLAFVASAAAGLVVAGSVPLLIAHAAPRGPATAMATAMAMATAERGAFTTGVPLLRISRSAMDAEFEAARLAEHGRQTAADPELSLLAQELRKILTDLSEAGLDARLAVARLEALLDQARAEAGEASVAQAVGQAAAAALGQARGVGSDGAALVAAMNDTAAPATDAAAAAGAAAARLALHGDAGRDALGRTAATAAAALASAQIGLGIATDSQDAAEVLAGGPTERLDRRLAEPAASPPAAGESTRTAAHPPRAARHLKQLRRDLEDAATGCRSDPDVCRRRAESAGRALRELQRNGRTAEARGRLAEAVGQLLDRLRRGGGVSSDLEQLRRFARSARGSAGRRTGVDVAAAANPGEPGEGKAGGIRGDADGDDDVSDNDDGPPDDDALAAEGDTENEGRGQGNSDDADDANTAGASSVGGGIGNAPGGRVLGARTIGGGGAGRNTPVALPTDGAGPSRAAIIAGAAARGFAATAYHQVFTDYRVAVEESLDATNVPPGQRYLVRRYFQLIRPRTP